jgi:hypothetical protein
MSIANEEHIAQKPVDTNAPDIDTKEPLRNIRKRGFMPENRLDLVRALMMHEVLGQPKCKQRSLRKQS